MNAFCALFVHSNRRDDPAASSVLTGYDKYGVWSLSLALEEVDREDAGGAGLCCLAAACSWIEIAGDVLADMARRGEMVGDCGTLFEDKPADVGKVTVARWRFWRGRLEWFAARDDVERELRERVNDALARFDELDVDARLGR